MKSYKKLFPSILICTLFLFSGCSKMSDEVVADEVQAQPTAPRCANGQISGIAGAGATRDEALNDALRAARLRCWELCRNKSCPDTLDGCTLSGVIPRGGTARNVGTPSQPRWEITNIRVFCDCECEQCDETKKLVYTVIESTEPHQNLEGLYEELRQKGLAWCNANECNRFKCRDQGLTGNPRHCDADHLNLNVPFGDDVINPVMVNTSPTGGFSGVLTLTECNCGCETNEAE